VVSSTPRPHFTPGKDPVHILQGAGSAPEPVWTDGKSRPHRDSIPDRPARSQSLYRLSYPAHPYIRVDLNWRRGGDRGSTVVNVLCHKPDGRWFDSRWCNWNFSLTQSLRSHYGPGVDSVSNRNEYQEYFLGVKSGRCVRLTTLPPSWAIVT